MKELKFKKSFEDHYRKLLGERYAEFKEACHNYLRRAVRVNTLKGPVSKTIKRIESKGWQLTRVPWCKDGFWVSHESGRRDIGNEYEHQLGLFYVQEPASMLPAIVLDPKPNEKILDMCAAPGSKTSQIAMYMKNTGALVANDQTSSRLRALGFNLSKCGVQNTVITQMDGRRISGNTFDRVLVDAPCSGTGTIQKSLKTLIIWNAHALKRLSNIQKSLVLAAYDNLKPGGVLVYSTCSVEPEENEAVVDYLLKKKHCKIEEIKLRLNRSTPFLEHNGQKLEAQIKKTLRIWPMDNDTEGFFVAKIRKNN